jgi:hypothetical protein
VWRCIATGGRKLVSLVGCASLDAACNCMQARFLVQPSGVGPCQCSGGPVLTVACKHKVDLVVHVSVMELAGCFGVELSRFYRCSSNK